MNATKESSPKNNPIVVLFRFDLCGAACLPSNNMNDATAMEVQLSAKAQKL